MSADNQAPTVSVPSSTSIRLSAALSGAELQHAHPLLDLLIAGNADTDAAIRQPTINIKRFVDGRGLACPMPLLKTKVALRDVAVGESVYVVATDANSQADITAFCRQSQQTSTANQLLLAVHSLTLQQREDSVSAQHFDTIYHFIITKTDSN